MKKIFTFLVVCLMTVAASAQQISLQGEVKKLNTASIDNATVLGRYNGNLILVTYQYNRILKNYVANQPRVMAFNENRELVGQVDIDDEELELRHASMVDGKIYLLMSKATAKSAGVYSAVVDAASMKVEGGIKTVYESQHKRKDKLYTIVRCSPNKEYVSLSILFDDKETKEYTHQITLFDNKLNTVWTKNYANLYDDIMPTNYGEVAMVRDKSGLDVYVLSDEGGEEYHCSANVPDNLHILNITDNGILVYGGEHGTRNASSGISCGAFDLVDGKLLGSDYHTFGRAEAEILSNRKQGSTVITDDKNQLSGFHTQNYVPTSFGAAMVFGSKMMNVITNSNGTSTVYYTHYGLEVVGIDTMGHFCFKQPLHLVTTENAISYHTRYFLTSHDGKVVVLYGEKVKSPTTIESNPLKVLRVSPSKAPKAQNVMITLTPTGEVTKTVYDNSSHTLPMETNYKEGNEVTFFQSYMGQVNMGKITF